MVRKKNLLFRNEGLHSTEVARLLLTQQPWVRFPAFRNFFQRKNINVAEPNQQLWIDESGQLLENVDLAHLVLASGKPVL